MEGQAMSPRNRKAAKATDATVERLLEGAQGRDVSLVQAILVEQGHYIAREELLGERFGPTTAEAVVSWKRGHGQDPQPMLEGADRQTIVNEGRDVERSVTGTVSLEDGTPLSNVTVTAFDRDFRARE